MSRSTGFALITALLILVVLGALGVGAASLANINLRIAENAQTQTQARFNAHSGMDTAFVVLAREFAGELALPQTLAEFTTAFPGFDNTAYQVIGYDAFGPEEDNPNSFERIRLRVLGVGARGAEHEVEALIEAVATQVPGADGFSIFGEGFVARGDCDINGTGSFSINFHCGGNINLTAGRLVDGATANAGGDVCRWGTPPQTCGVRQPPPEFDDPVFDSLREQVIDTTVYALDYDAPPAGCTVPGGSLFTGSRTVICVAPGEHLTITGNVDNLVVIGDETTRVTLDAVTGDPTDDLVPGITVVSGAVDFTRNAEFHGENTIIAKFDIEFGNNVVSHDETARTFIVTEGDFTLNGTGARDIYASFWVGGAFRYNGTPDRFRGTVVSTETIFGAGAGVFNTIAPPRDLENRFIPNDSAPSFTGAGIRVLARR